MATPSSTTTSTAPVPPTAKIVPHTVKFGFVEGENRGPNPMNPPKVREDPYYWMRDDNRVRTDVIDYLNAENQYTEEMTKHLQEFHELVYNEAKSYLKETDNSYPYIYGPYKWYTRTVEGLSYPINCRAPKDSEEEQIVLDENIVAKDFKYCDVGRIAVSSLSYDLIAYGMDTVGKEVYDVKVQRISTGEVLDTVPETAGSVDFDNHEQYIYYTKQDASLRPYQVFRHKIGNTDQATDELLFEEKDERFNVGFFRTRSERFLVVSSRSKEASEVYVLDLSENGGGALKCIAPRKQGCLYSIDHFHDHFVLTTNENGAQNFTMMTVGVNDPTGAPWNIVEGFEYDASRKLNTCLCFSDHVVASVREGGLSQVYILRLSNANQKLTVQSKHRIEFPEETFSVSPSSRNRVFAAPFVRLNYCSFTTPSSEIDYYVDTHELKTVKISEVPGYDKDLYESKRIFVECKGQDGNSPAQVPVSFLYHKSLFSMPTKTPAPVLLYGYGSYGHSIDPFFDYKLLPLLNRGVVFVVAHIRGGGEMGRYWYETEGKYLTKKNTFSDFIDVAKYLIDTGVTTPNKLAIEGRSAGGLLMGAVANQAPSLFSLVIAGVPFVDVLTTMSDASIPLTVTEWEEWGNPNEDKFHDYMLSYSPVDNVGAKAYPAMLVLAGLHDPRVAYWEPAKWVAHLRAKKTDSNTILLKTDMSSGHFSASDRYKHIRERAFQYAVLLDHLGLRGAAVAKSHL